MPLECRVKEVMDNMPLRFLTAGDSHGDSLIGIVEALPAGVRIAIPDIQADLRRRRKSYGRSDRQGIEKDEVRIIGGLWRGKTTGAPVAIRIPNLGRTFPRSGGRRGPSVPRPGHGDLAGCLKYGFSETTPIAERASARSTAMRVSIGALAKAALKHLGVETLSHVLSIGRTHTGQVTVSLSTLKRRAARSPVSCADPEAGRAMMAEIDSARESGDTLGGRAEAIATGVPPGLGSHVEWDRRLDARLAGAMMSIQSVKGVEIGDAVESSQRRGTQSQDAIILRGGALKRPTNHAGGIEGGMSNGRDIRVRLYAKPIPTVRKGLPSIDMRSLEPAKGQFVRSDACVVPAIAVIAEAVLAWEILAAALEKFGGDSIEEVARALEAYTASLKKRGLR